VATDERFVETRRAIRLLQSEAQSDSELRKWLVLELALVLAEATGRRLGSLRQLRWNDIDFKTDTILWRAEADKKRREWKVPMPQALREELRSFRAKLGGAFGGLLFASESDPEIPIRRDVLAKWLQQAERRAGLKKLDGSLWHAYRRASATSRKELPIGDVAAAGGWSDVATLLRCYQQPDEATMLSVMSHPRKVLDRVSGRN
jgi:integrase